MDRMIDSKNQAEVRQDEQRHSAIVRDLASLRDSVRVLTVAVVGAGILIVALNVLLQCERSTSDAMEMRLESLEMQTTSLQSETNRLWEDIMQFEVDATRSAIDSSIKLLDERDISGSLDLDTTTSSSITLGTVSGR